MVLNCRYKKVFAGAIFVAASGDIFSDCRCLLDVHLICSLKI